MNQCLLSKWLWKLETGDGLSQRIIRGGKYIKHVILSLCQARQGHSHFWQGLMKVKEVFLSFCKKKLGNGGRTNFWEDLWIGDVPIKFPRLYNLTFNHKISVARVFDKGWGCIRFRRTLWGETAVMWEQLQNLCADVVLTDDEDSLSWTLTKSGIFSVQSMYLALKISQVKWPHRKLWFVRVPLKVKVFLWLTAQKSILTRDVLIHRGWKGRETKCSFCDSDENIEHLFFGCSMSRFLWGMVKCSFGLNSVPKKFDDIGAWVWSFPNRDRTLVATG